MSEFTLEELANRVNGQVTGDKNIVITGAAKIDSAGPGEITFLANPKYKTYLVHTKASAVIIDKRVTEQLPLSSLLVDDVYFRFLQIFLMFNPPREIQEPGIHPSATIHSTSKLGTNVSIGSQVHIGKSCKIGNNTKILPGCVILDNVEIGTDCLLYPLVSIRENCRVGNNVIIHNGAVIGSDGFGFAPHEETFHKIPQIGIVIIEDEVEIGANCTIDRATMEETIIRSGSKLDNLIHIAHNVEIGESTVIAAQTGVAGSTKIGHHVMMGGQAGIIGHITIGNYAQIAAQSGVAKSVDDKEIMLGSPARPIMRVKRIESVISQLPELLKRTRQLENELKELKKSRNG
jgi:UDP-3-O-[3-hydroxymyristoyl] glucosamine N-acyltransferase